MFIQLQAIFKKKMLLLYKTDQFWFACLSNFFFQILELYFKKEIELFDYIFRFQLDLIKKLQSY